MLSLFIVELLKLKRSPALIMSILCPLSVAVLQTLLVFDQGHAWFEGRTWATYWQGAISLWYMLMLPLYIGLITALVNGTEHKGGGWRLMATMPFPRWQLFLCKCFVSWCFVLISSLLMYSLASLSIYFLIALGFDGGNDFSSPFLHHLINVMVTALPILIIGHCLSWYFKNLVLPLALSVIMTMTATIMVNSEKRWIYNPWTYHMTSTMVSNESVRKQAFSTAGVLGGILLVSGTLWLGRREVFD